MKKDKDFKKAPLFQAHLNPQAEAVTTLEPYQAFSIDRAYKGQTFFWAYPPHADDVIRLKFHKEIRIDRYVLFLLLLLLLISLYHH